MQETNNSILNPFGIYEDLIKQFITLNKTNFTLNSVLSNCSELDNNVLFLELFKQSFTGSEFTSSKNFRTISQMLSETLQSFSLGFPEDYAGKFKSILTLDIIAEPLTTKKDYREYISLAGLFDSLKLRASEMLTEFKTFDDVGYTASSILSYYYSEFRKNNDLSALFQSTNWTRKEFEFQFLNIPNNLSAFQTDCINEFYKGFDAATNFFNIDNAEIPESKELLEKWKERLEYLLITGVIAGEAICLVSMIISFVIDFVLSIVDLIYMFIKFYVYLVSSSFCMMVDNAKQVIEDLQKIPAQLEKVQKLAESVLKGLKEEVANGNLTPNNIQEEVSKAFRSLTAGVKIIETKIGGAPVMEFDFIEPMINDFLDQVKNLDLKQLGVNSVEQSMYNNGFSLGSIYSLTPQAAGKGEELLEYLWNYFTNDFAYFNYEVLSTVDTSGINQTSQKWEDLGHIQKISSCYQFWFNTGWYFGPLCCNLAMCAFGVGEVELILKGVGTIGKFEKFASAARKIEGAAEFIGKFYEAIAKPVREFFSAFQSRLLKWFDDLIEYILKLLKKLDAEIADLLEGAFKGVKKVVQKLMEKSETESETLSEIEKTYKSVQDFYDVIMILGIIPMTVMGIISADGGELSDATE